VERNTDHWMSKAREARALGETMVNAGAKRAMLEVAALYEELSARAREEDRTE